jgi:hypothetical protein
LLCPAGTYLFNYRCMKCVGFQILAAIAVCSQVLAQDFTAGMEITGFRVPDYDEQGALRAQLFGGHARVLGGGDVEITDLKIEMYKDGEIAMTVFAPHCFFNLESRQARSEGQVLIESGLMSIVGRGFSWSAEAGRFEILNEARVLVQPAARDELEELEL